MEPPARTWRKSSRSESQSNCVEVAPGGHVRDSKNPGGPVLDIPLTALISAIKGNQLDA